MSKADEFVPDLPVVEKVIELALLPVIQCCEEEMGESLAANLIVVSGDAAGQPLFIRGTRQNGNDRARGAIRLTFRKTFDPGRHRFKIEAIYPDLAAAKNGFSGFEIGGDVKLEQGHINVRTIGKIFRHNVWAWQGWR